MRLYHNPRCSKSRQARNLLLSRDIKFEDYRYLEKGIHPNDIEILSNLQDIIRISDLISTEDFDLSDPESVARLIKSNPLVLQRPVLVSNGVAVIGRPPENILTLLP